ncbi:hypothetical protein G4B88_005202 [Cannabis sativa]|uniref:Localized to the inner membrane of the chloroplast n=1 Tax=Cannabis sativa TaxID=3483 RepID=A0A7J6FIE2_CANSA|nr:hypothetical protein G4B88_005202 [Cannabis sativa]
MTAISNSLILTKNQALHFPSECEWLNGDVRKSVISSSLHFSTGSSLKRSNECLGSGNLSFNINPKRAEKPQLSISRKSLTVQAAYRYLFPWFYFIMKCLGKYFCFLEFEIPLLLCLRPFRFTNMFLHGVLMQDSYLSDYSDGGRPSSASIFVGGFVLGGIIVGTLGCVYAPQISKALTATDRKDLMRKLPKFIYDEEKALEKTRKVLAEKIAQLNSAIDDVSSQLRSEDGPNGVAVSSDEIEATI